MKALEAKNISKYFHDPATMQVLKEISTTTSNPNLDLQLCDLANLSSVRNVATILMSRYNHIDVP